MEDLTNPANMGAHTAGTVIATPILYLVNSLNNSVSNTNYVNVELWQYENGSGKSANISVNNAVISDIGRQGGAYTYQAYPGLSYTVVLDENRKRPDGTYDDAIVGFQQDANGNVVLTSYNDRIIKHEYFSSEELTNTEVTVPGESSMTMDDISAWMDIANEVINK